MKAADSGIWERAWSSLQSAGLATWEYLSDPLAWGSLIAVVLLLLVLYLLSKRQPARVRAFNNTNGYVEISRAALVDIIRATAEQVDIEKKPGVHLRTRRGRLHVDVRIRMLPTRRLTEVSEILQKHLMETLSDGMGIQRLGSINVLVVGVRVKTGKEARASLPLNPHGAPKSEDQDSFELVEEPERQPEYGDAAESPEPSDHEPADDSTSESEPRRSS